MKKHINIITYCTWTSIGSILQAYALSSTIESCGYEPALWLEEENRTLKKRKRHTLKSILKELYKTFIHKKLERAYEKRISYIQENMDVCYFSNSEDFKNEASQKTEDVFIAGSDQIWNPDRCNPVFFLDFVKSGKRISYAASMGNTIIPENKKEKFRELIGNFEKISVREQECKDALCGLTEKEIMVNIDPTFLLEADKWRRLEKEYKVKKPYILLYMLYWDENCRKKIKELKKRTGLHVYAICSGLSKVYADKLLFDVGIEEFLWLIDHAEYVVTSSFHGVALSTILNKKFSAVINPASPSRIENLLRTLSIPVVNIDDLDKTDAFDYEKINNRIFEEAERSIDYLKEVIG